MSNDLLIKMALQRQEAFKNLSKHLKTIKKVVAKLDPKAEVYLFGSVAEDNYNYSSDIDILVVTDLYPAKVICELWEAGIEAPFEIHVYTAEKAAFFKKGKIKKL
jgi:predicted nucleotidyltransferase